MLNIRNIEQYYLTTNTVNSQNTIICNFCSKKASHKETDCYRIKKRQVIKLLQQFPDSDDENESICYKNYIIQNELICSTKERTLRLYYIYFVLVSRKRKLKN